MKYKTIDLYAGIGGIRRGFELTNRFTNVLSAKIDKYACQVYKHLYNDDKKKIINSIIDNKKIVIVKTNFF